MGSLCRATSRPLSRREAIHDTVSPLLSKADGMASLEKHLLETETGIS
jgi:hypothetical protein